MLCEQMRQGRDSVGKPTPTSRIVGEELREQIVRADCRKSNVDSSLLLQQSTHRTERQRCYSLLWEGDVYVKGLAFGLVPVPFHCTTLTGRRIYRPSPLK